MGFHGRTPSAHVIRFRPQVERRAAVNLVRATCMLVVIECRRYVRVPLMTEVSIVCSDKRRLSATSLEMSSGGMSLKSAEDLTSGTNVEVSFSLLTLPRVWVRGVVTWRKPTSFGVRVDAAHDRRHRVREWIDSYLEI